MAGGMLWVSLAGAAWAGAAEIPELVVRSRSTLRIQDGRLVGDGAAVLARAIADAQHVLLGEQHLTRETPAFAQALLPTLLDHGFGVYAVETGPISAERLVELVGAKGEREASALEEELEARPRTYPFFDHAEEVSLLRAALAGEMALWGLDQEFFFAGRMLLERLAELAPGEAARALVDEWQARTKRDFGKALLGERDVELLLTSSPKQVDELRSAFEAAGDDAARILDEVAWSAEVYGLFRSGANYESNHRRIALMKEHLRHARSDRARSQAGDGSPKIFFKFGSMHMGRGHSPLHQLDLGNHAAELAAAAGRESVHLVLMGLEFEPRGGERSAVAGLTGLEPLTEAVAEEGWTLFDLRSLRPHLHSAKEGEWPEALARLVWRYDFAVFAPVFHGATPFLAR